MSIAGYFGKEIGQLRMVKLGMPKEADEAGIEYEGEVLRGETSVEHARALDGLGRDGWVKPERPVYREMDDYDPVMQWHCRL